MRYLGNKSKLLENFILPNIKNVLGDFKPDIFFDIFTGTGSVGESLKDIYKIYGCDLLKSSYLVAKAKIELNECPSFEGVGGIESILDILNTQKRQSHIYREYSEGGTAGRLYFSDENGKKIDGIIYMIHYLKKKGNLTDEDFIYLYLLLIENVHNVANTTGVFGAFLKELSGNAKKVIRLEAIDIKPSPFKNRVFHGDSFTLLSQYVTENSVIYIDPPYNNRQYGSNYHLLETICSDTKPHIKSLRGKPSVSGLPVDLPESDFCKRDRVEAEFRKYLGLPAKYMFISYNSESLISKNDMLLLLSEYGSVNCIEMEYKRFKSNSNKLTDKNIMEYLYVLKKHVINEPTPSLNNISSVMNIGAEEYSNLSTADKPISPLIQWAGGKRRLLPEIMKYIPDTFGTYYEPFLGGGSLLFELKPNRAFVSDINPILVEIYKLIQSDPQSLMFSIDQMASEYFKNGTDRKNYYLEKRDRFNALKRNIPVPFENLTELCALFIFLNKTGFNAVYRENSKGIYNVPFGNGKDCSMYDKENILNMSEYLARVEINCAPYTSIIEKVKKGDLVYMDPPYHETFNGYVMGGWNVEDTREVIKMFKMFVERGARVILSNNNHPDFIKMFEDIFPDKIRYEFIELSISRTLNSKVSGRGQQKCELLVVSN